MARIGYLELYPDAVGQWRWRIIAGNGKLVDTPGEAFDSKSNAKRAGLKQHPEFKEYPDRIRVIEPHFK